MSGERPATNDATDRALAPKDTGNKSKRGDKPKGAKPSNASTQKTESTSGKSTPGFAEGNKVLSGYNLSVSGRQERVLSPFKADKFFHFVDEAWSQFVNLKPTITSRYSLAEFRHASALQLYSRLESVKFDALGVKPAAPVRIPLPRNTRVFQPLWSILANIGIVNDSDLRVTYIPDGILPQTEGLTDPEDIENLLSCTLYDWQTSWSDVLAARKARPNWQHRIGHDDTTETNESGITDRAALIAQIAEARSNYNRALLNESTSEYRIIDGWLYKLPKSEGNAEDSSSSKGKEKSHERTISDSELKKTSKLWSSQKAKERMEMLIRDARKEKKKAITPTFDVSYKIESYQVSDGTTIQNAGAYGAWLHWDPQLWLEYEQLVEIVTPIAMFSLSMPAETTGTYAWVLPVEKRQGDDSTVIAKMPRASIAPVTWILALLLQSSTLPPSRRSTFYTETDGLSNVLGLRVRYIRAAVKDPSAVENYGTY